MNKLVLAISCLACASALPLQLDSGSFFPGTGRDFGSGGFSGSFDGGFSSGNDGGFVDSGNFDSGSFSSGSNFVDSGNFDSGNFVNTGSFRSGGGVSGDARLRGISFDDGCSNGQVRHADGQCVTPQVSRNMFLYAVPAQTARTIPARNLPNPKVHLNYVFVRTENNGGSARPVVVPPPKQKTIVYVLNRSPDDVNQEVIEVPHAPVSPEVFFVNYEEGDERQLPGGVSLQQALSQSLQQARVVEGGATSGIQDGGAVIQDGGAGIINLRSQGLGVSSVGSSFGDSSFGGSVSSQGSFGGSNNLGTIDQVL